jgi:hypothetical protein
MSEPIDRLSRFTPDAAGLDRDRLLFEAGRASARPHRRWRALCAGLAASQLMTLTALCWPRSGALPAEHRTPVAAEPAPAPVVADRDEPSLWRLRDEILANDGRAPAAAPVAHLVASEPPLHAFGTVPKSLLE